MNKQEEIRKGMDAKRRRIYEDLEIFLSGGRVSARSVLIMLAQHDVGIRGRGLGASHPHLADYYTVEPLIEEE